jgi:hypothetical protein
VQKNNSADALKCGVERACVGKEDCWCGSGRVLVSNDACNFRVTLPTPYMNACINKGAKVRIQHVRNRLWREFFTVPPGSTRVPGQRADRQNRIPTSTRDISTNMSAIEAALAAIDALELGEKISYTQISNQYGVVRSTLTRRHQRLLTT